jgi:hypothetical protein
MTVMSYPCHIHPKKQVAFWKKKWSFPNSRFPNQWMKQGVFSNLSLQRSTKGRIENNGLDGVEP